MLKRISVLILIFSSIAAADFYLGLTGSYDVELFDSSGKKVHAVKLSGSGPRSGNEPISMAYGDFISSNEGNELILLTDSGQVEFYTDPFDSSDGQAVFITRYSLQAEGRILRGISFDPDRGELAVVAIQGNLSYVHIYDGILKGDLLRLSRSYRMTGGRHAPHYSLVSLNRNGVPDWALLGEKGYIEVFSGMGDELARQLYLSSNDRDGTIGFSAAADGVYAILHRDGRIHYRSADGLRADRNDIYLDSNSLFSGFTAVSGVSLAATQKSSTDAATLWIDASAFQKPGGWLLDTQFVHLMGSPYLIAAGIGTPVENAAASFTVADSGTYRLWIRSRNWIREHSPGRFNILINDNSLEQVFGAADSDQWVWEEATKRLNLSAGEHTLTLNDLTGDYGRCAAVILSRDPDYSPPDSLDSYRQERARLTGRSLVPVDQGNFDVIVAGGGVSGVPAALAAARNGARTALIHNRPVLGGNASSELGVGVVGASRLHAYAQESGICEELIRDRASQRPGGGRYMRMTEVYQEAAEAEPNLTVFFNRHVCQAVMNGDQITAIKALDTVTGEISLFSGKIFIDTTGDGWLGYYAGADYRVGRESRSEYNESLAPETEDQKTMSGCLMGNYKLGYTWTQTDHPVEFIARDWAYQLPPNPEFGRSVTGLNGQWWLEHPNHVDDLWEAEHARDELIRVVTGYWDWLKNKWELRERAEKALLTHVPITVAKRESRRLLGDHVLNQNDVLSAREFPDVIGHAGWPLDVHHPKGILSGEEGPFDFDEFAPLSQIPYRSLYSRNIANLLFAGRCMSATHVALGTVRVQATCMVTGQAAGTAAAMCVTRGVDPRTLGQRHIQDLQQQLLRDDQYIPGIRNEDPLDLARHAEISASSAARYDLTDEPFLSSGIGQRGRPSGRIHYIYETGHDRRIGRLFVHVQSNSKNARTLPVTLRGVKNSDTADIEKEPVLRHVEINVPGNTDGFVEVDIQTDVETPYFALEFGNTPGLTLPDANNGHLGARAVWRHRPWHDELTNSSKPRLFMYTDPPLRYLRNYSATNIVSGISRIVGQEPNLWKSDPELSLPQWLQLNWGAPAKINRIHLTFDTNLDIRNPMPVPVEVALAYEVQVDIEGSWQTVVEETANYQRFRVHSISPVETDRLRVVISKTGGDSSARIYELRVYSDEM